MSIFNVILLAALFMESLTLIYFLFLRVRFKYWIQTRKLKRETLIKFKIEEIQKRSEIIAQNAKIIQLLRQSGTAPVIAPPKKPRRTWHKTVLPVGTVLLRDHQRTTYMLVSTEKGFEITKDHALIGTFSSLTAAAEAILHKKGGINGKDWWLAHQETPKK